MGDVLDVQAPCGNVRGDQHVQAAVPEPAHHPVALLLGQPAVQGACIVAAAAERLGQVVDLAARPGEDEGRGRILHVEDPAERRQLVAPSDDVGSLTHAGDAIAGRLLGVDRDPGRIPQVTLGDAGDRRRDGGREERGLALRRCRREDRVEILGEAHVEHLVGFVEDDDLDLVEPKAASLEVVDGPARRRDDDVDAPTEAAELLADRLAAIDGQDAGTELLAVAVERLGDLHRQLARRHDDERGGAARPGPTDRDPLQRRQGEGGGLARPGRRLGEEVAAGEEERNGLALDRRRLLVAQLGERPEQARVEVDRREAVGPACLAGAVGRRRIGRARGASAPAGTVGHGRSPTLSSSALASRSNRPVAKSPNGSGVCSRSSP